MRKVLHERSRKTDGLQLRQFRFFHRWQVFLLENLIVWPVGANECEQPSLIRKVHVVDAAIEYVLLSADPVKLLQKNIDMRWPGAREHLDISELGTKGLARNNISHVLLIDHGGLELGEIEIIAENCLIEVTAVLDKLGELIDGELDSGTRLHEILRKILLEIIRDL